MVVGASVENLHAGWFAFWLKTGKSRVRRALQCVLTMCGIPVCWSARDSQKQQGKPKAVRISSAGPRRVPTKMVRGIAVARRREPFGKAVSRTGGVTYAFTRDTVRHSAARQKTQQNHFVFRLGVVLHQLLLIEFRYHVLRCGVRAGSLQGWLGDSFLKRSRLSRQPKRQRNLKLLTKLDGSLRVSSALHNWRAKRRQARRCI